MSTHSHWILAGAVLASLAACGSEQATGPDPSAQATVPIAAKPAGPSSSAGLTVTGVCRFYVTYSWSGFKGRNLTVYFGLYDESGSAVGGEFAATGQSGRGGSVANLYTWVEDQVPSRTLVSRGRLENAKGQVVTGSQAVSANSVVSTCG